MSSPFLDNGVTAHRGNSHEFPENTLPAFENAIAMGADWIELDVHLSVDGQLVVIHDAHTARVGDRDLPVANTSYEALRVVDVAHQFREQRQLPFDHCPTGRIPLLSEAIELVKSQYYTRLSIQPKSPCVDEITALVQRKGAERWVGFNDGDLEKMRRVRELAPDIPVFWDRGPDTDMDDDVRTATEAGFEAIVMHYTGVTAAKVASIRAAGLEAGAWTVNDPGDMEQLLWLGIYRIYTDCPRRLLEVRARLIGDPDAAPVGNDDGLREWAQMKVLG